MIFPFELAYECVFAERSWLVRPLARAGVSVVHAVDDEVFPIELTLAYPSDKGFQ